MRLPDDHATTRPAEPRGNGRDESREADSAAGLGPRVTAVFTAAEQAADHILQMAREEVADMRRRAETEMEAFRREQRHQASEEARLIISTAREEADSIRREAKAVADGLEEAARKRERWVNEGIRLMTERAEWARQGLDEVLSRLEPFAARPPHEWAEIPSEPLASLADGWPEDAEPATDAPQAEGRAEAAADVADERSAPAAEAPESAEDWRPWRQPDAD